MAVLVWTVAMLIMVWKEWRDERSRCMGVTKPTIPVVKLSWTMSLITMAV